SPAVTVQVFDQFGNFASNDNSGQVTLSVASGPGGFTAGSTTTATVTSSSAACRDGILDTAGTYTLGESGTGGITGPNSTSFTVVPAAADHLAFGVQPGTTVAGVAVSPAVTVRAFDRFGNLATNDNTDNVTLLVATGPGGFTVGSTTTVTVNSVVATFSNLILNLSRPDALPECGTGGITGPASSSFTVVPAAANHLAFNVQP